MRRFFALFPLCAGCAHSVADSADSPAEVVLAEYNGELVPMAELVQSQEVHCRGGEDGWSCSDELVRPVGPSCTLWQHINFTGTSLTYSVSLNSLSALGWNDRASSYICYQGATSHLYRDSNWLGGAVSGTSSADLRTLNFNDKASSVTYP